jgi:hypothetical protein
MLERQSEVEPNEVLYAPYDHDDRADVCPGINS